MYEINPVLAGTFDAPDFVPNSGNISSRGESSITSSATTQTDSRRYTQFDRTSSQVSSADFSFSDALDAINPLQHIPIVSSAYRAITGSSINPVSRVAGDILYGGLMGGVTAVAGAVAAIGDTVIEGQTGQNAFGSIATALFSPDNKSNPISQIASSQAPNTTSPTLTAIPPTNSVSTEAQNTPSSKNITSRPPLTPTLTAPNGFSLSTPPLSSQQKSFALNRSKIVPNNIADISNQIQSQNRTIALSEGSHAMRFGSTIYTGRFMNGTHLAPQSLAATSPNTSLPSSRSTATPLLTTGSSSLSANETPSSGTEASSLPQPLMNDIMALKALNQYKNLALTPTAPGSTLDLTN